MWTWLTPFWPHRSDGSRMHNKSLASGVPDGVSEIDLSLFGITFATTFGISNAFKQRTVLEYVQFRKFFMSFEALSSSWFVPQTTIPTALIYVARVISISFSSRGSWLRYSQDVLLGGIQFFHGSFKIFRLLYRRIRANSCHQMRNVHTLIFSLNPANSLKARVPLFLTQIPGTAGWGRWLEVLFSNFAARCFTIYHWTKTSFKSWKQFIQFLQICQVKSQFGLTSKIFQVFSILSSTPRSRVLSSHFPWSV